MLFRLWESINSYMYDERMLEFLAELTELHVNPSVSDPQLITSIPDDARSEGESRPQWSQSDLRVDDVWPGLYKDVGIFSEDEWSFIMCKCLASMGACPIQLSWHFIPTEARLQKFRSQTQAL
jgi:proteasome activator subunit 4